jgi:O-antigen/teichoic acid export membrane protein
MNPSETTKKIASNTIYQIIGKIVSMSITVLATVIVTRMYNREGYGEFNLMQNFPALFFIVVDFGINAIATKELSQDWSKAKKYLGNIMIIRIGLSVILMTICFIILQFFPYSQDLKFGIYLSLFLILTQALYATTNIIFQVKLRNDYSTIGYILGSLLVLVLVLVQSYFHFPISLVSFSYVLGGILTFFVNIYFIKKLNVSIELRFDKDVIKDLLIQSLPLGLMFVFSQINFKADSILISVLKLPETYNLNNTESVAIYGLPYKIFEVSLVIPTFFMNSTYPVLVRHMIEGKEKLKQTFLKSVGFLFAFGLLSSITGVILAPLLINILGGSQFTQSILVLRLLFGGLFVFYLTQPLSWLIVTLGNQKYLPLVYLVSAIFNVSANLIFIPKYSFYASSVITWSSESLILIMLALLAYKSWKRKYA